jgi:tRNA (guanine9-N1)-methyltransferase
MPQEKPDEPPLSKNALKRKLKNQRWEEGKDERRAHKKAKIKEKKERQKLSGEYIPKKNKISVPDQKSSGIRVVVDCGFDDLMTDKVSSLFSWLRRHVDACAGNYQHVFPADSMSFGKPEKPEHSRVILHYSEWQASRKNGDQSSRCPSALARCPSFDRLVPGGAKGCLSRRFRVPHGRLPQCITYS